MADDVAVTSGVPEGFAPVPPVTPVETQPLSAPFDIYSKLDPSKDRSHLDNMDGAFRGSLSRMLEEAPPEIRDNVTIYSGARSLQRQQELWDGALKKYGSVEEARKWVAPPGRSFHNKGMAADLHYGNDAARDWVHANAGKYDLQFRLGNEPWHIEPVRSKQTAPTAFASYFDEASAKSGVPLRVLTAIAKQESDFDPNNVNKATGATGVFQFIPSTWAEMMKTSAPTYGLSTLSNPKDPRANILMGAEYARLNGQEIQKALGRPAKDGELYMAHFLGPTGAVSFIKQYEKDPNSPAAANFSKAAASNPTIFFNKDGSPRTVAQVHDFLSGVVDKVQQPVPVSSDIDFGKRIDMSEQHAPPLPPSQATVMSVAAQMAEREKSTSFYQVAADAWAGNLTSQLIQRTPDFAPDNNYRISEDDLRMAKELGVQENRLASLGDAVSKPHFNFLINRALDRQESEQRLAEAGWTGTGLQLAASILDPVAIAAGAATGGLADYAAAVNGFGRVGRMVAQGVAGAGTNVGIELGIGAAGGDPSDGQNLAYTAALGALFGIAGGAIGRNPYLANEAALLSRSAEDMARMIESGRRPPDLMTSTALSGSLSAGVNPHVDLPVTHDEEWARLVGRDVPTGFGGKARIDAAGQLKVSPNPGSRLGSIYGEDAVGGSKESKFIVNPMSVSERAARRFNTWWTDFENTLKPAYEEWAKDNNLGVLQRLTRSGAFGDLVTEYVRQRDPILKAGYHPAVRRAGDKLAKIQNDILKHAQNPFLDVGDTGRSVRGFETVPDDLNYMMRVYDARKINEVVENYSKKGLTAWFRGAIQSAQPHIDSDILDTLSNAMAGKIYKRANHVDEESNLLLSGFDQDQLKAVLLEEGISIQRIEKLLNSLKTDEQVGADVRAKHRTLLDESFELPYPNRDGTMGSIRLKDITVTDAFVLARQYFHHMSGRVELAATRIKNPTTGGMLVDGITSDNDHVSFRNKIKNLAEDNGILRDQTDKDLANLDWLYDRILGRPDPAQLGKAASYLRLARKFQFLRLMGQVGFAQIQDFSSGIAQLGFKAVFSHSPAFRRMINMNGESVLRHGFDREIEAIIGGDPLKGLQHWRDEDFAPTLPGKLGTLDNTLNVGQNIMSKVSGLDLVNTALQRWMAKVIVQKFADLAKNPSKVNRARMLSLGLDDAMLKRILAETKHFTTEKGAFTGAKVTKMNLHNWTDDEARAAFENSLFRWTRRIVQQNDYGNMHRWSSNPLWQTLFQFRSFALGAWSKQFLHNVQMRDWESFHMMWMSMALGAATYAVRTNLQAMGRSDRDEFLEKRLAPANLAGAAFQLAGWSSILPMAWDTGARLSGFNPFFDFRTSGQATDALLGNPTVDFINRLGQATKGTKDSFVEGRPMSQQEIRNWSAVAPFGNWMPVVPLLNSLISDRAPYAPKQ